MEQSKPSWKVRRRIILTTLGLCFAQIAYLTMYGDDTRLNEVLATGAYGLAGATIGAYVFGATWSDNWGNRPSDRSH